MHQPHQRSSKFDKEALRYNVGILQSWERGFNRLSTQFNIKTNIRRYSEIINKVLEKNIKETMDIAVIGKTSSGKSSLINSFLGREFMQCDFGHTTRSTVTIQTTTESPSYYKYSESEEIHYIDFNDEEQLEKFHDIVDMSSDEGSHTNQCIELYISESLLSHDCIISDRVAILDTPGLETDVFHTKAVKRRVLEADALILVVDIITWSDNEATRRLLNDKSFFVRPNVIVAVSKCDNLRRQRNPRKRENKEKNIKKELSELVVFEGRTVEEMDTLISFVSAELILEPNNHQMVPDDVDWLQREYDKLRREILSTARTNSRQKKDERIDDAIERCMKDLKQELFRIDSEMTRVRADICELVTHIQESFNDVKDTTFVGTVDIERLYELESGREKVSIFLNHCKERGFNDMKRALIKQQVNPRISDFFDGILREEIDEIVDVIDKDSITLFFESLDRPKRDSNKETLNEYKSDQREIKNAEIQLVEEQKKTMQLEEKKRIKEEHEKRHRTALTEIYVQVIKFVSTTVQTRLIHTAKSLDYLRKENTEEGRDINEAWQWVSNNIKSL